MSPHFDTMGYGVSCCLSSGFYELLGSAWVLGLFSQLTALPLTYRGTAPSWS